MSVRLMSAVFESKTLGATERLIMLALADHADDEGRCYPSIDRLCQRTGLKERAVQTNIRKLREGGYLDIKERAGRNGSNLYFVRPQSGTAVKVKNASTVGPKKRKTGRGKLPVNRFSIFDRDDYTCVYCGFQDASDGNDAGAMLHIDHATPLSRGGNDGAENLRTSCVRCNLMKGDMTEEEFRDDPRISCTPHFLHPASDDKDPRTKCGSDPARDAPKPSVTIIEPSLPPKPPASSQKPVKAHLPENWVPSEKDREYALSLNLTDSDIEEIANDFCIYWTEGDGARKKRTERGWHQAWRNRCRDVAASFIRNRKLAGASGSGGYGQGGDIASIVARRQFGG